MRILCLTPWFPNAPGEREGNYIFDSVMALQEQGVDVSVLLARVWKPWKRDVPDVAAFPADLNLQLLRYPSIPRDYLRRLSNRLLFSRLYPAILSCARRHDVQLIHAHTEAMACVAAAAAKTLGIPSMLTIHGINTSYRYLGTAAQKNYFCRALNAVDRVILVGEPLRSFFAGITGKDSHFRIVHNGFRLPVLSESRPICTDKVKRLISVSNLHEGKGIDLTIKALARLKNQGILNWSYLIVGDGYMHSELQRLLDEYALQDRVAFAGAVAHERVADYLRCADVFVLPSYREAFGIAYLEAMACGLLTIGVKGQGPAAFINHRKNGLLAKTKDINDLANCIRFALENGKEVEKMAEAGRITANVEFNWANHARELISVFRELLPCEAQS